MGLPPVATDPDSTIGKIFQEIATKIVQKLE
jgi:hypothetical protein